MEVTSSIGQCPLHLAVVGGHDSTVRLLLEMGADKEAEDFMKRKPLHLAADGGYDTTVRVLVEMGAAEDAADRIKRRAAATIPPPLVTGRNNNSMTGHTPPLPPTPKPWACSHRMAP
ncbi:hypothetical protein K440DRAFT_632922 [Wilcoxina mikolae CBS 423.85]|nr:hypothetical protein K440DRAFT_632922 [Wilcoxina mikolae CBS 423.85]